MQICDKCYYTAGEYKPGPIFVQIGVECFHMCTTCAERTKAFINEPEPESEIDGTEARRGRPRKKP